MEELAEVVTFSTSHILHTQAVKRLEYADDAA